MKFILNQIKMEAYDQPFKFDQQLDVSELEDMDNDIRKISPVNVQGNCTIDGDEFIFSYKVTGEMILPCARTLVDVPYDFALTETEVFSTSPFYTEEDRENEVHQVQGEILDLRPCILENILLAVPFRVFSDDEEVLKNALSKGEGWELTLETDEDEKQEKTIDPRMQKLQSLLDDNGKDK